MNKIYFLLLIKYQANNPSYAKLLMQRDLVHETIEEVVKFQHGALNNSVDTMGDVLAGYYKYVEF